MPQSPFTELISPSIVDTSLVPTLELPLQTILTFQACPAQVAASYLQGLCSAEGYLVERDSLLGLYDLTCKSTDIPLSSFARVSDFPVPDLRRTINCLQLRCSTIGAIPPSGCIVEWHTEPEYSIEYLSNQSQTRQSSSTNAGSPFPRGSVIGHADLVSFIDSELIQSSFEVSEVRVYFLAPMQCCHVMLTSWARHSTGSSPLPMMNSDAPY